MQRSQEDQGYIARSYGYYDAEGYGTETTESKIRKVLLTIFILLDLFVLCTTITHGKKWYCNLYDTMKKHSAKVSNICSAAGISMAMFNCVYLISSVLLHTKYFVHSGQSGCHFCSQPPHTSSYYKDEVAALTVKGAVFLFAIITELLVAIQISSKVILPIENSYNKCLRFYQIILLWNTFVFVQIWVGLVLLPACIFLIIAPLQTIPSTLCSTCIPSTAYGIHSNFAAAWKSA